MLRSLGQIRCLHCFCGGFRSTDKKISFLKIYRVCSTQYELFGSGPFQNNLNLVSYYPKLESVRYKSKGKNKKVINHDSDDEFSDDEEDFKEGMYDAEGGKVKKIRLKSLRLDQVLKMGLGLSRRKLDEVLLGSKIHLNGKIASKKGFDLGLGDVLEIFEESTEGDIKSKRTDKLIIRKIEPLPESCYFVFISVFHD